jgi:hypothetical protein
VPTILGNTPQNQIDALPIITVAAAASAGDIQVVGGIMTKFFNPAATGISSVATGTDGTNIFIASSFLDLRGLRAFSAIMSRTIQGGGAAVATPAMGLMLQWRLSATDNPPTTLTGNAPEFVAMQQINNNAVTWPAIGAGETQRAAVGWEVSDTAGVSTKVSPATIGSDVRLLMWWSTNPVGATNRFTLQLWGSS